MENAGKYASLCRKLVDAYLRLEFGCLISQRGKALAKHPQTRQCHLLPTYQSKQKRSALVMFFFYHTSQILTFDLGKVPRTKTDPPAPNSTTKTKVHSDSSAKNLSSKLSASLRVYIKHRTQY